MKLNKKCFSIIILFALFSLINSCGCQMTFIDPNEAINILNTMKSQKTLSSLFKSTDENFNNDSYIECYVDNSYGMQGFIHRSSVDLQKDQGLQALIDKIQLLPSKGIKFRQFDGGELKPIPKEKYPNFKSMNFYTNTLTPLSNNINQICAFIEKHVIDGAYILTDGIDDMGMDTNQMSYVLRIRDWISHGNSFEVISIPLLFKSRRWYSPIEGVELSKFYSDYSNKPTFQYLYVLAFADKTFSNKTLGEQLLPFAKEAYPNASIEYLNFNKSFFRFDGGFSKDNKIEGTFQNKACQDELNTDLKFKDYDKEKRYWIYDFNRNRKLEFNTYDENDVKTTVKIDKDALSLGYLEGTIKVPNMLDLNKAKIIIHLSGCSYNSNEKTYEKLEFSEKEKRIVIDINEITPIKDELENDFYNVSYLIKSDNILLPFSDFESYEKIILKVSVSLPYNIQYNKKVESFQYQTILPGIRANGFHSNFVFMGLKEQEIFNAAFKYFSEIPELTLFSDFIEIDF